MNVALSGMLGAGMAIASRDTLADEPLGHCAAFWALIVFEVLLYLPATAMMLVRFPDWSLMYLIEPSESSPTLMAFMMTYLAAGLLAFLVVRRLIRRNQKITAAGFFVLCALLAIAIGLFGVQQIMHVGTTAAYRDKGHLDPIIESPILFMLIPGATMTLAGWGVSLWRLRLFSQAWRRQRRTSVEAQ